MGKGNVILVKNTRSLCAYTGFTSFIIGKSIDHFPIKIESLFYSVLSFLITQMKQCNLG